MQKKCDVESQNWEVFWNDRLIDHHITTTKFKYYTFSTANLNITRSVANLNVNHSLASLNVTHLNLLERVCWYDQTNKNVYSF